MTKALMIQGTGSDVGKSVLVAGLCRAALRRGLKVAPFKAQNMSNNAAATPEGGEIGRAQALQAQAAGRTPHTDMNPVLLKPQSDRTAQVIVQGKAWSTLEAQDYFTRRDSLLPQVLESFMALAKTTDLIIVEGAGSPAEINLRARDIANMGFARAAGVPVILAGDIDRGGVIAAVVGTQSVLAPADARQITGFLINRFRGDLRLFDDGLTEIVARTGWPSFGVVPWLAAAARLPAEDAVVLERPGTPTGGRLKIAVPLLSRIANFDDLDPLRAEPGVQITFVPPGQPLPRDAEVIILPGTKSTSGDLAFLRAQGWDHDLIAHARAGGRVLGLCGGYQMLGRTINDPEGSDGAAGETLGLGLLDLHTVMTPDKRVTPVTGRCAVTGAAMGGYEIHVGRSHGPDTSRPLLILDSHGPDGARSADGLVEGAYVHGLFGSDDFRKAWLERARPGSGSDLAFTASVEQALDDLAEGLEAAIDVGALLGAARPIGWLG